MKPSGLRELNLMLYMCLSTNLPQCTCSMNDMVSLQHKITIKLDAQ